MWNSQERLGKINTNHQKVYDNFEFKFKKIMKKLSRKNFKTQQKCPGSFWIFYSYLQK